MKSLLFAGCVLNFALFVFDVSMANKLPQQDHVWVPLATLAALSFFLCALGYAARSRS